MTSKRKSIVICLVVATVLIVLDQLTKLAVRNSFGDGSQLVIWEGVLKLLFTKNSGAAWGIFKNQTWILAVFSLIMSVGVFIVYVKLPENKRFKPLRILLIFILAGAIGNGIDRFVFQYVTDFIYFELINFPVFNVADCYITVSMFVLVYMLLFYYKDEDFDKNKTIEADNSIEYEEDDEVNDSFDEE